MTRDALSAAVALFDGHPSAAKWHVRIRRLLSRLEDVAALVPASGNSLEVGSGHGLVSLYLALAAPGRTVLGVDIDAPKVEEARRAGTVDGRVRFEVGDALALPHASFDAVVIVDVLYLLDEPGQAAVLEGVRRVLKPGGRLVWKAQDQSPAWKYRLTKTQEWITTTIGLTAGRSLTFLPRARALELMTRSGFKDAAAHPMKGRIYTDVIYTGTA